MKKYLLVITMLAASTAFSQTENNLLSISAGPSVALGNFSKSSPRDENAGLAQTGGYVQVNFEHRFISSIGATATVFGQLNPVNTRSLEQYYNEQYYGAPISSFVDRYFQNWQFDKKNWHSYGVLAGAVTEWPVMTKLHVKLKAQAGIVFVKSPELNGKSYSTDNDASFLLTKGKGNGFAYALSGGIKHQYNKKISLLFDVQYFGSSKIKLGVLTQTFTGVIRKNGPGMTQIWQLRFSETGSQTISTLTPVLGIGITL